MVVTFDAPVKADVSRFFWRAYNLEQHLDRLGLELDELETDVESRGRALFERVYPNDLRGVRHGRYIGQEELELQKLADFPILVAENAKPAQADVDGLAHPRQELHPGGPTIKRGSDSPVLSALGRLGRGSRPRGRRRGHIMSKASLKTLFPARSEAGTDHGGAPRATAGRPQTSSQARRGRPPERSEASSNGVKCGV